MLYLFVWWVTLLLVGFAAFPIAFRFFPGLPDRGYASVKPLGLLLIAYPFWLLTSFGFIDNTFGAILLICILVAAGSWGMAWWQRELGSLFRWAKIHLRYMIVVEIVFLIAFLAFAYYRSFNPEITATEKPMEFMFLNSILRSAHFPPHDSWLSGYAISYYYFGYIIVALLTKITSVPSNFSFNLGLTMVYALSATGAFGLGYDLVRFHIGKLDDRDRGRPGWSAYFFGGLAIVLLLVVGNLEAPFESLHNVGFAAPDFYENTLGINGLANAPVSGSLVPTDNWWWWRASRVVSDKSPIDGTHIEVIDEFPSFSFLLGDLHPHVLALPFDLLALAIAFHILARPKRSSTSLSDEIRTWFTPSMLLIAIIVGALGMLNTWDLVTYGFEIIAAQAIALARDAEGWTRNVLIKAASFGLLLFSSAYFLFIPFYLGLSSQVQGIMISVFFKTSLLQYLIMFGLFIFVLTGFVLALLWDSRGALLPILREIGLWGFAVLMIPIVIALVGMLVISRSAALRAQAAAYLNSSDPNQVISDALSAYFRTLLSNPGVFLLLTVLIASAVAILRFKVNHTVDLRMPSLPGDPSIILALLLAITGFALTLGVEFVYVLDVFGSRMNTVFKLYFQSWALFSIASAFGAYYVWSHVHGATRFACAALFGILLALGLVYPALAYPDRANDFQANAAAGLPTLDGTLWMKNTTGDDYAGIQWLNSNAPDGTVILEAPGPQYSQFDRVSVSTGFETVLGWGGHEFQWRGNGEEGDKRETDVSMIYKAVDPNQARTLLTKYRVDYVVVGGDEREKYSLNQTMVDKFGKIGQLVFEQGSMKIFLVDP